MPRPRSILLALVISLSAMAEPFPLSPGLWTWLGRNRLCAVPAVLETHGQDPIDGHFLYQDQPVGMCKLLGAATAAAPLGMADPSAIGPMLALGAAYGLAAPWLVNFTERNTFFIRRTREELATLSASDDISGEFPFWSAPRSVRHLQVDRSTAIRLKSIAWGREQTDAETKAPVSVQALRIVTAPDWRWEQSPAQTVQLEGIVALVKSETDGRWLLPLAALRTRSFCLRALEAAQRVNPLSHIQLRK